MKMLVPLIVVGVVLIAIATYFLFGRGQLPQTEIISTREGGKDIMITDGVKHSVPLDHIVQGCPGKDCIPSIDNPQFESVNAAVSWLREDDIGLALSLRGEERFYPYRILVTHEIVNDTVGGQPASARGSGEARRVLVTYCPLCFTGIVFDPLVQGERVEFGVSGKLWNSNLIMYDRKTENLWSQITGEAIVGDLTGARLDVIPSDITKFGLWHSQHPDGQVLSRNTGRPFARYESIPYGGDLTDIEPFFPLAHRDNRLDETAYVLGIVLDGKAKAYHFDAVKQAGQLEDTVAGRRLLLEYQPQLDAVQIVERTAEGEQQLAPIPAFWFSWVATYPNTELWKG